MADATKHISDSSRKTCEGCGRKGNKTRNWLCRECSAASRKGMRLIQARRRRGTTETVPCLTTLVKRIQPATCYLCGVEFVPKGSDRAQFCGRACGLRWAGFKTRAKSNGLRVKVRIVRKVCVACNGRHQEKGIYCSDDCRPSGWVSILPSSYDCRGCGKQFAPVSFGGMASPYCSDDCRGIAKRKARRSCRAKRDAAERGANGGESIDPIKVFERDGWRCGICGCKTSRAKRGTYDAKAPELDHIVALANGGRHTWDNVQCSCRKCNGRKGASDYGQIPMFPMG